MDNPLATPGTPNNRTSASFGELSPPSSQGTGAVTAISGGAGSPSVPNANGKRPLTTDHHSNGHPAALGPSRTAMAGEPVTPANGLAAEEQEVKTHAASGYTWMRPEDEPGYGWRNKRAMDEANHAWGDVLHKDRKIGNRYGDPFEMADAEAEMLANRS